MIAYRVWSDDFEGQLMTERAYTALLSKMSISDFALHRSRMAFVSSVDYVLDVDYVKLKTEDKDV